MSTEPLKTAVISGGAGGLGVALCEQLIAQGWHVCLIDLPGQELDKTTQRFADSPVSTHGCDLTAEADVVKLCAALARNHPLIKLVIYNAGVTQIGELTADPASAHRKVFDINYFGALYLLRGMLQPVRQCQGIHLAISSVAGFAPLYHRTAYSASKHAMEGLFKSLRAEELEHGVDVLIASPSFIATNIGSPDHAPGGIARPGSASDGMDYMSPEKAAAEILAGVRKKAPRIPVGRIARWAWHINRFFPGLYFRLMMRSIKSKR